MALDALIVAILPNHGITDFASFEDFDDAAILAIMRQVNRDPIPRKKQNTKSDTHKGVRLIVSPVRLYVKPL